MKTIVLKFKHELYPKEALLKAAYHFIDRCYIHVDLNEDEFIVHLTTKKDVPNDITEHEFENELLAQTVRYHVYSQTHVIREILMARAMSSTITGSNTEFERVSLPENLDSLENILTDWFEKNGK
ncbi:MAG: His-Xaa-Ser system protein HxsD [Eubacteriales bacterium]|jgi:His-Xaa-Ser system protein HxsD